MEINLTSEQIHYLKFLVLKGIADAKQAEEKDIQHIYEEILLELDKGVKEGNHLN
ncbi:hypothetical protein [Crocosphaera sp.]|uniref:hypothetical protein n=1 Tax=Crocosphaera sp. TaxID=2729996 RepID=UPI002607AA51|nr:hypothetical protein [Crocosphaera sp.]MDJ0582923.1 hypothetical protein [Crocosphaera sp.]